MTRILLLTFCVLPLMACSGPAKTVRLYNPDTGHIVKCSGPAMAPEVVAVNNCIYDHEQMGYEIFR